MSEHHECEFEAMVDGQDVYVFGFMERYQTLAPWHVLANADMEDHLITHESYWFDVCDPNEVDDAYGDFPRMSIPIAWGKVLVERIKDKFCARFEAMAEEVAERRLSR
jgi:hypothetical protein